MTCSKKVPVGNALVGIGGDQWRPVETGGHLLLALYCANCATCSWETLTMLNPQFLLRPLDMCTTSWVSKWF